MNIPDPFVGSGREITLRHRALNALAEHARRFEQMRGVAPVRVERRGGTPVLRVDPGGGNLIEAAWLGEIVSIENGRNDTNTPPSFVVQRLFGLPNETAPSGGAPVLTRWQEELGSPRFEDSGQTDEQFIAWPHPSLHHYLVAPKDASAFDFTDADYEGRKPLSTFYREGQRVTCALLEGHPWPVVLDLPDYGRMWLWAQLDLDLGSGDYDWTEVVPDIVSDPPGAGYFESEATEVSLREGLPTNGSSLRGAIVKVRRLDGLPLDLDKIETPATIGETLIFETGQGGLTITAGDAGGISPLTREQTELVFRALAHGWDVAGEIAHVNAYESDPGDAGKVIANVVIHDGLISDDDPPTFVTPIADGSQDIGQGGSITTAGGHITAVTPGTGLGAGDVSVTAAADKIVKADGAGKIDADWLPDASGSAAGKITAAAQTIGGTKTFTGGLVVPTGGSPPGSPATGQFWHLDGGSFYGHEDGATRRFVTVPDSAYAQGQLIYIGSDGKPRTLDPDTDGYVLTTHDTGADPTWEPAGGGTVDADDVTFVPGDTADWDSGADPGDVADALDQLANRMTDLEDGGGALTVLGRAAGTSGARADIAANSDGQVLIYRTAYGALSFDTLVGADIPAASATARGTVELANDGEVAALLAVQANDGRLSDARTPVAHATSHISGGSDPFTSSQLLEAVVKRLQESTGPTTLTMGNVGNGQVLKRVGTDILGANVISDLQTQAYEITPTEDTVYYYDYSGSAAKRATADRFAPRGFIDGLILSNGTDATNDIDVAAGQATFEAGTYGVASSWFYGLAGKQLDASWAAGAGAGMRDTGSISNAWWHIFLIGKTTAADVDILASLSPTAPTMPGGWDLKRRIGAILRTGGAIKAFYQLGDTFLWKSPVEFVAVTNLVSASGTLFTGDTPTGVVTKGLYSFYAPTSGENAYISSPNITDEAVSGSGPTRRTVQATSGAHADVEIETDTSSRVRARGNSGTANDLFGTTRGWVDPRGKHAA